MPQLDPQIGEFYRYYQGGTVQILSFATHTETGEPLVIYQDLFGRYDTWATPRSRFVGEVDFKKHPACPDRFRYTFLPRSELHRPEGVRTHSRNPEEGRGREPEREQKPDREYGREPEQRPDREYGREPEQRPDREYGREPEQRPDREYGREPEREQKPEKDRRETPEETSSAAAAPVARREANRGGSLPPEKSLSDLMLAFLDERDFEKKDEILAELAIRPDLNDGLIDNLAAALDVVIDEGPLDRRFSQLRYCVRTRARFENSRLR